MEQRVKGISYGHILAHILPGALLTGQLVLIFIWISGVGIFSLETLHKIEWPSITGIIIVWFVAAALLGNIVDAIHHLFFRSQEERIDDTVLEFISTSERLGIYVQLVDEDYWYHYECYANLLISMVPGLIMLLYRLYQVWALHGLFYLILLIIYVLVMIVLFSESKYTLKMIATVQKQLKQCFQHADELLISNQDLRGYRSENQGRMS